MDLPTVGKSILLKWVKTKMFKIYSEPSSTSIRFARTYTTNMQKVYFLHVSGVGSGKTWHVCRLV